MEAFLVSTGIVALAEMGDKTQLLSLVLAARFRRPWPIVAAILVATLVNHSIAGAVGAWITALVGPQLLRWLVAASFLAMAAWMLVPDKLDERIYSQLTSDHPIDLTRYQVLNCYSGKIGLINSGGASGSNDFAEAVMTAVVNKRAGGSGLISGRKAFQRPIAEGAKLLHTIQDVYLAPEVTIA